MYVTLSNFREKNDGKLDQVHSLRQSYKADLDAIIGSHGTGVATVNSSYTSAFSYTNKDNIAGHTFAHEIGHNFGCYHNRGNSNEQHDYAHGYQNPGAKIRSMMAYSCSNTYCQRVLRYSSPGITYNGNRIGDSTHDCARKIKERRVTIANFEIGTEGGSSGCSDVPNWKDSYGDGCDWYENYDSLGCPKYGSSYNGGMGVAQDACCYCGGGNDGGCSDVPNWKDSYGDGCDWYEKYDSPGCPEYGDSYDGGITLLLIDTLVFMHRYIHD